MTKDELKARIEAWKKGIAEKLSSVDDEIIVELPGLFPIWTTKTHYLQGNRVEWGGKLYKCVQEHTSQDDWTPDQTPALWVEIAKPGEIPEWKQPAGAHDAYMIGAKVRHNNKIWINTVDYNAYEPGVYGWNEVTE